MIVRDLRQLEWLEQQKEFKKLAGLQNVDFFGGAPDPPDPPDPVKTAAAQSAANVETARAQAFLNNPDQTNPFGSLTNEFFKDPETGLDRFQTTTSLNPTGQRAFDAEQGLIADTNELAAGQIGRVQDAVKDPFSFEGLAPAPTAGTEGRQRAEDAVFGSLSRRLTDRFNTDEDRLRGRLATQGITLGSEAFNDSLEQFNLNKNDAFLDASNQAFLAGGAEQNRQFGLDATARDRAIQEESFLRNIPINEIGTLLGTGQIGLPQFGQPAQTGIAGTDVIGAQALSSNIAQQNFLQKSADRNALIGGLFKLGGAALGGLGSAAGGGFFSSPKPIR